MGISLHLCYLLMLCLCGTAKGGGPMGGFLLGLPRCQHSSVAGVSHLMTMLPGPFLFCCFASLCPDSLQLAAWGAMTSVCACAPNSGLVKLPPLQSTGQQAIAQNQAHPVPVVANQVPFPRHNGIMPLILMQSALPEGQRVAAATRDKRAAGTDPMSCVYAKGYVDSGFTTR